MAPTSRTSSKTAGPLPPTTVESQETSTQTGSTSTLARSRTTVTMSMSMASAHCSWILITLLAWTSSRLILVRMSSAHQLSQTTYSLLLSNHLTTCKSLWSRLQAHLRRLKRTYVGQSVPVWKHHSELNTRGTKIHLLNSKLELMHRSPVSHAAHGPKFPVATLCSCQYLIRQIPTSLKLTALFQSLITSYPRTSQ